MIRFYQVSKTFPGGHRALDNVTFDVEPGEFVFVRGPSGAGKTTLLRLIYRAQLPTSGQILVRGRNVASLPARKVPYLRRSIGVVFQSFRLIPRKTVLENVSYLPRILGASTGRQREMALEVLDWVGLGDRLDAFPRELSGGEQQRVATARALVNQPEILIADEPTGNLDPQLSRQLLELFERVQALGTTVLLATHDESLIRESSARVLHLVDGKLSAPNGDSQEPVGDEEVAGTDSKIVEPWS